MFESQMSTVRKSIHEGHWDYKERDFNLSPFTGLDRKAWLDSARWLLKGLLQHSNKGTSSPTPLKRSPRLYPREDAENIHYQVSSADLEAVARSFLIAAHLIRCTPDTVVCDVNLADYYKACILRFADPDSPNYLDYQARTNGEAIPDQAIVEIAGLCISLWNAGSTFWNRFSEHEKKCVLSMMCQYGHSTTHVNNWRFFNVIILSFLACHGYDINEATLDGHLMNLLCWYAGDGWYRDYLGFDYYSPWAFNFYAPIWIQRFGHEHRPEVADLFLNNIRENLASYPAFFSREGHSLMWGRSAMYRCAASAPIVAYFCLEEEHSVMDPGWARRICSGNLMQFLSRTDTFHDGVLEPGFYGAFDSMLQRYSCAASPYWLAKIFQCLSLDKDHPFWVNEESEGFWGSLSQARITHLPSPGLTLINRLDGSTECVPSKVKRRGNPIESDNYQRLAYHSEFPWQASDSNGQSSMSIDINPIGSRTWHKIDTQRCIRVEDGVIYKQAAYSEMKALVDLALIPIEYGHIIVTRLRLPKPCRWRLTSHAIGLREAQQYRHSELNWSGFAGSIIHADSKTAGVLPVHGWAEISCHEHQGLHPETPDSVTLSLSGQSEDHSTFAMSAAVLIHHTSAVFDLLTLPNLEFDRKQLQLPGGVVPGEISVIYGDTAYSLNFGNVESCLAN